MLVKIALSHLNLGEAYKESAEAGTEPVYRSCATSEGVFMK